MGTDLFQGKSSQTLERADVIQSPSHVRRGIGEGAVKIKQDGAYRA